MLMKTSQFDWIISREISLVNSSYAVMHAEKGRKLNLNKWLNINKQFIETSATKTFAFSLASWLAIIIHSLCAI